jgi:hypothetical protein
MNKNYITMISRQQAMSMTITQEEYDFLLEYFWNSIYSQFISDCIQPVYDEATGNFDYTARLTLSEIYSRFRIWFRATIPGFRVPERRMVREELISRWGHMNYNFWPGIGLVSDITNLNS